MAHRAHLHSQLKEAAASKHGIGEPVTIHTSSPVIFTDGHTATITFEDGSTRSGDVIVGADGVHSKSRRSILSSARSFKTEASAFRFIIERQIVLDDPETAAVPGPDGSMDMWYAADRKIVVYSTSNNKLLNFVCIHPAHMSDAGDTYDKSASKSAMLEVYKDWHPSILAMLNKVDPADLKVFPFFDLKQLPTFVSERVALIGDAAHPFTPHLAQGGAMAIEDGVSLSILLENASPADVPERLQLYNQVRYTRGSSIQEFSRQVGRDGLASDGSEAKKVASFKCKSHWYLLMFHHLLSCMFARLTLGLVHGYMSYALSHDEVHFSTQQLRNYMLKSHKGAVRWRQPTAFGLLPSPRQDALGNSFTASLGQSTSTSATILFETSATLLRNLFPEPQYYFEKRDTVAKVSVSVKSLRNMAWLGGGGYDLLQLDIHGVCYKGTDGVARKGTYCPLVVENLADPILTGREELGFPKLFSDIDISRHTTSYRANVSWRGAKWASLEISGLQTTDKDPAEIDRGEGVLAHKYIPSTEIGKPDSDYTVLHLTDSRPTVKSVQAADRSSARLNFHDLGRTLLPTLHPVANRLAELPIFRTIGASVVEYQGVSDITNVERLY